MRYNLFMKLVILLNLFLLFHDELPAQNAERSIYAEINVPAKLEEVWEAWTTEEGVKSFFAPACHIVFRVKGPYEMYFNQSAEAGKKGGEGNIILAYETNKMISFTWNAPPTMPTVRQQLTHVTIRFTEQDDNTIKVTLNHDGWGDGEEWDKAFNYFDRQWNNVVLPMLKYRFENGSVNWKNPPKIQ
ncbi:MAG: SRPBCC family protein [Ignavibacteria bacterium]